ncbi:methyl-accepting chemotaxis protein [Peribacillus sp. SCS-37]|uniref:methyl-accepting chemotaxis protein n=1 Tax=Paraperibacillus esterisolvens TaxID=3115296 RepID=UPI003905D3C7
MKRLSSKISLMFLAGMIVVLLGNGYLLFQSNMDSVERAVAENSSQIASSIAKSISIEDYEAFLADPRESEVYWELRESLNDIREKTGILYLYTMGVKGEKVTILIDGQERGSELASPIDEPTSSTTFKDVQPVLEGRTATTPIVHDKEYGDYLSAFVPIKKGNEVIGVLGVDIEAGHVKEISNAAAADVLPVDMSASAGLMLIFAAILFLYLKKRLKPLGLLRKAASELEGGDLLSAGDRIKKIKVSGRDEIASLTESFTVMIQSISTIVEGIKASSGSLTSVTEGIENQMADIRDSNKQIVEGMQQVASAASVQLDRSSESVSSMQEMTAGIQRIAEAASDVSSRSADATREVEKGNNDLSSIIKEIENIKTKVDASAKNVEELGLKAGEIENIVDIISAIAEQTNLLALNAAIEAARAGEHGKGFAVVSQEVRKLAEESKQSAQQITEVLQSFKKIIAASVTQMEEGSKDVETSTKAIVSAGENFSRILHSVEAVNGEIQEVSAVTEQMSAGSETIMSSIEEFSHMTRNTAEASTLAAASSDLQDNAVEQVTEATAALKELSETLQQSINQFKI